MTSLNSFQLLTESKVCVDLLIMSLYTVSTYLTQEKIELLAYHQKRRKNFKTIFLKTLYKPNDCKCTRYQLNSKQQISYYKLDKYGSFQNKGIKAYYNTNDIFKTHTIYATNLIKQIKFKLVRFVIN